VILLYFFITTFLILIICGPVFLVNTQMAFCLAQIICCFGEEDVKRELKWGRRNACRTRYRQGKSV